MIAPYTQAFRAWWTVDLETGRPVFGSNNSLNACATYVSKILQQGKRMPYGGAPMLIGEVGIPFDLSGAGAVGMCMKLCI